MGYLTMAPGWNHITLSSASNIDVTFSLSVYLSMTLADRVYVMDRQKHYKAIVQGI